jgi:hypothetical protein
MEQQHSAHILEVLLEAFTEGYTESFIITATGLLISLASPGRFYEIDEVEIQEPIRLAIPATLFRITTKDGLLKGTLIDWEH